MIKIPDRVHRDDRGASLLLVLIVITVVAIGAAALLTFVDTSFKTTMRLGEQAAATYNADGAAQAAINNIRNSAYRAAPGQQCFGGADALKLDGFYGADSAAVSCAPDPSKVLIHCDSLTNCNRPGNAILTLGDVPGEDGLNIQQPTNSVFRVQGGVFSNSTINVENGKLSTNTRVYARRSCGTDPTVIESDPAEVCNYGSTPNVLGDDPGYLPDEASVPAYRPLPACTTSNSVVTFEPGYYDDAYGLSKMMSNSSKCAGSVWWFRPGSYYFDFHNADDANPLLQPSGGNEWLINSGQLVAGTPVDAAGVAVGNPTWPATIPGSCDNPIRNAGAKGVQFVFGGDSRLRVKDAKIELCGTYSVDKPPLAIYGLTSGTATTTGLTGANALKLTAVDAQTGFGSSASRANLANLDGSAYASWRRQNSSRVASVRVSGFVPATEIPAGSILTSATVQITHRHSRSTSKETLDLTVTPVGTWDAKDHDVPEGTITNKPAGTAFVTDPVALDVSATSALAETIHNGSFDGATIELDADLSENNDVEDIDSIQLELTYVPPAYRAASGCIDDTDAYNRSGGDTCALVRTDGGAPNSRFFVQGTTYAPGAVLDVTLNNLTEQVFRFGVIARSLWIKLTGSFTYSGPVIEVPNDSPGFGFSVYLTTYLCPGATTCDTTGTPVLRTRVAFVDGDPGSPYPGRRQVIVLSWSRPG
jgi:hypothetical protein